MPEYNTIKLNQLDQAELSSLISGTLTGSVVNYLIDYIADGGNLGDGFVYTSATGQTILGTKTFSVSPIVPYTGATGAVVSRKYVDDLVSGLNTGLSSIASKSYVFATGDQQISGLKVFAGTYLAAKYLARTGFNNTQYGIDLDSSELVNGSGDAVLDWDSSTLKGTWSFDASPQILGTFPVLGNTNQTIGGVKTFSGTINVPDGTGGGNAVSYQQFKAELNNTGDQLSSLVASAITGIDTSGFAGVLSVNGKMGHVFTQGRGNVTITQVGNVLSISGDDGLSAGTSAFISKRYPLDTTGSSSYRFEFDRLYSAAPLVFPNLQSNTNYVYANYLSGIDTSGFNLVLATELAHTGFNLDVLVIDQTGELAAIRGEQGLMGVGLYSRGNWSSGVYYDENDFVLVGNNSWVCLSGHTGVASNNPTGVSGDSYWNLLVSSQRGYNGGTFLSWGGAWDAFEAYESGTAVSYNGSTYGTTGSTVGDIPTGEPWYLVASRGDSGISFRYYGDYSESVNYTEGAVVFHDNASYVCPASTTISGLKFNPLSSFSEWEPLQSRGVVYNGNYLASKVYRKNDLAYVRTGYGVTEPVQYIWTSEQPTFGLHPNAYYNSFIDCDGGTGYNLFELSVAAKDSYNPRYGQGSATDIKLNLRARNAGASGFDTLNLIRDKVYYFDNENTGLQFIIATSESGGNYTDQYITNVRTGSRLVVGSGSYDPMAYSTALRSGTMHFSPNSGTPDTLYLCSPVSGYMGWKLNIIDDNPWEIFTSGIQGNPGESGASIQGDPGLAFTWKGNWNLVSVYNSGDSVYHNGSSYATNASTTLTPPPNSPWFLVAKKGDTGADATGLTFVWKGNWNVGSGYLPYESVYYEGSSYGATGSVPAGTLPTDTAYWSILARSGDRGPRGDTGTGIGFSWMGAYSPLTNYASGSAVYFQGSSYGTTGTSSGVAPTGSALWTLLAAGSNTIFNWRYTWLPNTYYHSGDAVTHSGSAYACFSTNYNDAPGTSNTWGVIASKGDTGPQGIPGVTGQRGTGGLAFDWRGEWDGSFDYVPYDSVFYAGASYATLSAISGVEKLVLPPDSDNWFVVAEKGDPGLAFSWKGTWSSSTLYRPYESVYFSGRSYATLSYVATGVKPNTSPWFLVAGMGGEEFCMNAYLGTGFPQTGVSVFESFCAKDGHLTGFAWGMAVSSAGSYGISGTIYKKDLLGSRTDLTGFNVRTGVSYWSGNANFAFDRLDRLGLDISGDAVDAADIAKLNIGLLGYYSGY